jgi:hypothetical protein
VNSVYRTSRPGKARRAKTNGQAANRTTTTVDSTAMIVLLVSCARSSSERVRVVRGDPRVREPDRVVRELSRVLEAAETA